ncbi:MAG: flagellar biosynthesis protein FlhA [Desulfobacterota bacterium]|nr:flagellar biosynthesis protein FlhA [Thermodesulfobacteriota bacterium]
METVVSQDSRLRMFAKNSDIAMSLCVIGILTIMIIPLPTWVLDILLSCNITISVIMILVSMYVVEAISISVFPSFLLISTLFRLALNISSTRLILLNGDQGIDAAGQVIKAFGSFVVGGNYVVGAVVFAILIIINFVVITKGSGRIAEVAARFTLDAMPGKQMSIDADLNNGLITEEEAKNKRMRLQREADFYGAMDGASKFVRGDVTAGMIITFVNIIGGLVIGVLQKDMTLADAARTYTILTIGDGLVSAIPALIISTAAGIIVSRAASEGHMGTQMVTELAVHPRAFGTAAGVLTFFGIVPGLPTIPFFVLAALAGFLAYTMKQAEKAVATVPQKPEKVPSPGIENVDALLDIDDLELEVGYGLIPLVDKAQGGDLLDKIRSIRRQFALDMGVVVPPIHIRDNLKLPPNQYAFLLRGIEIARGEVMPDQYLAMETGVVEQKIEGIPTREPAFGLPALWISADKREKAQMFGYTVVDPTTVLGTHISELLKNHIHEIIGRQEVQALLNKVAEKNPKLVDELVPGLLPLGAVQKVIQNLLRERVSIRNLVTILEVLADYAPTTKNTDILTEYVRQALGRHITRQYVADDGNLYLITLDPNLEDVLSRAVQHTDRESFLSIDPTTAHQIIKKIEGVIKRFEEKQALPVLLCSPAIRSNVKKLLERFIPHLAVLSHTEVDTKVKIKSLGTISIGNAA